jgi:hypothetical protein
VLFIILGLEAVSKATFTIYGTSSDDGEDYSVLLPWKHPELYHLAEVIVLAKDATSCATIDRFPTFIYVLDWYVAHLNFCHF